MNKALNPVSVLVVDDNDDDILIIRRVFKKVRIANGFYVVKSGQEALDFLNHEGKYAEEKPPTPGVMLLDISMPGLNGFDVLNKIKADQNLKKIPVIMLTTSNREEDIVKSFENGACSYITKPVNFTDFVKVIEQFDLYWTLVSKVPVKE